MLGESQLRGDRYALFPWYDLLNYESYSFIPYKVAAFNACDYSNPPCIRLVEIPIEARKVKGQGIRELSSSVIT